MLWLRAERITHRRRRFVSPTVARACQSFTPPLSPNFSLLRIGLTQKIPLFPTVLHYAVSRPRVATASHRRWDCRAPCGSSSSWCLLGLYVVCQLSLCVYRQRHRGYCLVRPLSVTS